MDTSRVVRDASNAVVLRTALKAFAIYQTVAVFIAPAWFGLTPLAPYIVTRKVLGHVEWFALIVTIFMFLAMFVKEVRVFAAILWAVFSITIASACWGNEATLFVNYGVVYPMLALALAAAGRHPGG